MSTIGSGGGLPISPLAGSVAGTAGQVKSATANQTAAEGAQKAFEAQRQAQLQRSIDDVNESAETGDRDADGREAWRWSQQASHSQGKPPSQPPPVRDPDGDLGQSLDLNA